MTTVYVVEQGEYSDRHIVAVFTDEAAANLFSEPIGGRVSKFVLDRHREHAGLTPYEVSSKLDSIEVDYIEDQAYWLPTNASYDVRRVYGGKVLEVTVFARDKLHARKIAADRFREFVAMEKPCPPT